MKFFTYTFLISAVLMLLLVACSSEKTFKNTQEVINALDKYDKVSCEGKFFQLIGANDGMSCELDFWDYSNLIHINVYVEIYTFDGNAKEKCLNAFCTTMTQEEVIYYSNVLIWVDSASITLETTTGVSIAGDKNKSREDAKWTRDHILSDLKD
tara:strand:+ start:401 stop:862 length:462 start_codon:yes stop_codon:yes gene_type:complete